MMLYDWLAICACLFLVNDVKTLSGTVDGNADRKDQESKSNFPKRYRRNADSVKKEYGELKYSGYLEGNAIKRADINGAFGVTAEKRTIKIGAQVCGAVKDSKKSERWDDKRSLVAYVKGGIKRSNEVENTVSRIHSCCEDHNKCPRSVPAKSTKYGFTNDIEYAIMSCKCDTTFRRCLKDIKSYTSDAIGHLYFDALKIPCLTFYDDNAEETHLDTVSVVPDLSIAHPKIGGAQVILKSTDGKDQDSEEAFYTHEQNGIADSKEMGRKSSHPQLVRSMQYPTPKIKAVTNRSKINKKHHSVVKEAMKR